MSQWGEKSRLQTHPNIKHTASVSNCLGVSHWVGASATHMKADTNHLEAQLLSPLQETATPFERYPKLHTQATHRLWIIGGNAQNQPVGSAGRVKSTRVGVLRSEKYHIIFQTTTCLTWRCHGSEPLSWVPLHYRRSSSGLREPMRIWSETLACKGSRRLFCWDPLPVTEPAGSLSRKGTIATRQELPEKYLQISSLLAGKIALEDTIAYFACTVKASSQRRQRPQDGRTVVAFDSIERSDARQGPHPSQVFLQHVSQVTDKEGISVILPWSRIETLAQHKPAQRIRLNSKN